MIGYYIHHHGHGHLVRAQAVAAHLAGPVTAFSSLPRPGDWAGEWIDLPRDTADDATGQSAHDRLHWVPLGVTGLRARMARIAAWIGAAAPSAFVVDVSVEVALLARLHGVPVVTFALPGERADPAHELGYDIADAIIATWPAGAGAMVTGMSASAARRMRYVGGLSRIAPADAAPAPHGRGGGARILAGAGGDGFTPELVRSARAATPQWRIAHLGGGSGQWVDDPAAALSTADVVITHAGQSAIADVAAARRPAIVVPQPRPHAEQAATARALARGDWPAVVVPAMPEGSWAALLGRALAEDARAWTGWVDGRAAARTAGIIAEVAAGGGSA